MSCVSPFDHSRARIRSPESHQPIPDSNFDFPQATVEQAVRQGKLLSMEIEFSLRCNFRCPYCYVPHDAQLKNGLTVAEIKSAILQAGPPVPGKSLYWEESRQFTPTP